MPTYEWEGRSLKGELRRGVQRADSEVGIRTAMRKEGVILTKITEREEKKTARFDPKKKVKRMTIGIWTRQLSTMLNSGLPLVQSLDMLSQQIEDATLKGITKNIKERIEEGVRFADALRDYPQCFDDLYVNLVVAGEEGGLIDAVLVRLAVYIEKSEKLKKKVKSALIYPISIIVVAFGVVLILLLFVIPVFEGLFSSFGKALPAPTQIVINISKIVKAGILYMIAALGIGVFLFRKYYKTDKGERQIDALSLKVPLFGNLLKKASVARVTRTLATLLSSGVSILESLSIVARIAGNRLIEESLITARVAISEGRSISEPLKESGIFPPMVVQMVQVGESTGALDAMLNRVADFYEEDVDNMVTDLMSLMEPMIMVFLGIVLGGLIIAMYLPIFQLGTAVG
jgi:type IV pilus assembly protein PilC